jgi:hypothetical protein
VIDTGFSDHKAQVLQIQVQRKNKGQHKLKEEYRIARSYNEENIQYLNYLLENDNWEHVLKENSVNNAFNEFSGTLQYCYNIAMPKKKIKTIQQDNTWVTAGIRVAGKRLRFLHNLMKEGNVSEEDKKYYSHYKKIYNKVIREAKKLTNNRRICASENKSKAMWDLVKAELGNQKNGIKNIEIREKGAIIQDPKDIANVFNEYYTSIAKKILNDNPVFKSKQINVNEVKYNTNSMFLTPTTEKEVGDIIKGLGNKKSTGIDDIPDYIIKKMLS